MFEILARSDGGHVATRLLGSLVAKDLLDVRACPSTSRSACSSSPGVDRLGRLVGALGGREGADRRLNEDVERPVMVGKGTIDRLMKRR